MVDPRGARDDHPGMERAHAALRTGLLILAAAVVLGSAARTAWITAAQLGQRTDLLLESTQYASIMALRRGLPLYGPETYADVPFTLTMYTPLYFALAAALPQAPGRPFLTGRLLSLASLLGAAALLFGVPRRPGARWLPALAAACFFLFWPVASHASYLRCDSLAVFLSAAAVTLVRRRTPRAVAAAALCCTLTLATKQSYVAPAAACLVNLALSDRRAARRFGLWFLGAGLAGALAATAAWGHGFWFSIVGATTTPLFPPGAKIMSDMLVHQPLFGVLTLLSLVAGALALRREGLGVLRRSPELPYAACSFVVATVTLAKIGSGSNYLIECMLAQLMWLVRAFGDAPAPARAPAARRVPLPAAALLVVLLAAALELATTDAHRDQLSFAQADPEAGEAYHANLRAGFRAAGHPDPLLLNLGPPRHSYGITTRPCLNDPFLFNLLWNTGRLGTGPLLEAIEARRFDVVLLRAAASEADALDTPYGEIARAVAARYRLRGQDAEHRYFVR